MEKFTGNSNASKDAQPQTPREPVAPVSSDIKDKVKVKSGGGFFRKIFAQDMATTVKDVGTDVALPGLKSLILNVIKSTADYLFLGTFTNNNNNRNGITNYNGMAAKNVTYINSCGSVNSSKPAQPQQNHSNNSIYNVEGIIFDDIGTASEVLWRLKEIVSTYGMASVLDFYDLIDKPCEAVANKYGWRDLSNARVERVMTGYRIVFGTRIISLE